MGIVKVLEHELLNVLNNRNTLVGEFKKAISLWKEKKYELSGVQVGKIVGILLE